MKNNLTPMMEQYYQLKAQFQEEIVFFRLGDFYEMFGKDAEIASKILNIILTQRVNVKMCGIPYHAKNNYIQKLLDHGYKIVICEQVKEDLEDNFSSEVQDKRKKGLFKREVSEIITPGTILEERILNLKQQQENLFILAIDFFKDKNDLEYAFSYIDISTGDFFTSEIIQEGNFDFLYDEIARIEPKELVIPEKMRHEKRFLEFMQNNYPNILCNYLKDEVFFYENSRDFLKSFFEIQNLNQFGFNDIEKANKNFSISSAGALIFYIQKTQKKKLKHVLKIENLSKNSFLRMSKQSIKHLELIENNEDYSQKNTLYSVLSESVKTLMGKRLLRRWILYPSLNKKVIEARQNQVNFFYENLARIKKMQEYLSKISDIERINSRIILDKISPKDLLRLKDSLIYIRKLNAIIKQSVEWDSFTFSDEFLLEVITLIQNRVIEDLNNQTEEIICKGFSELLDNKRLEILNYENHMIKMQNRESERLKINNLRIKYNKQNGYFIEISHLKKVEIPKDYIKKQSLTKLKRYSFPELIEYEALILNAKEEITQLEENILAELIGILSMNIDSLQKIAKKIAHIDVVIAFAYQANKYNYYCPKIIEKGSLIFKDARHPVIEKIFVDKKYIPNDLDMNLQDRFIYLITGPNMSGKSTFLRQNCLLILMAQIGSFLPVSYAEVPIMDQIFTRIGAMDFLSKGESTFFVEMRETSAILNQLSARSFIIMDEIGRGTATYDGIAISYAILEYLAKLPEKAYILFSTHYHELSKLEKLEGIRNYFFSIEEKANEIIFLHKIKEGCLRKSYGIPVARLTGIPKSIIKRSEKLLNKFENRKFKKKKKNGKEFELFKTSSINLRKEKLMEEHYDKIKKEIEGLAAMLKKISKVDYKNIIKKLDFFLNFKKKRN